jgi:hypothetical protein
MEKANHSGGEQMVEVEVEEAVRGRQRQFQNNHIHTVVISLMVLATGFFWFITPEPVNSGKHHTAEENDQTLSPNKPFSWSEVCVCSG